MKEYARLQPLVKNPSAVKALRDINLDQSMNTLAKRLAGAREAGIFEVHIVGGRPEAGYRVEFTQGKGTVSKATGTADFAVRISADAAVAMAKGELSPVDAFLSGRMEVQGDLGFAKRLFAKAASGDGELDLE